MTREKVMCCCPTKANLKRMEGTLCAREKGTSEQLFMVIFTAKLTSYAGNSIVHCLD